VFKSARKKIAAGIVWLADGIAPKTDPVVPVAVPEPDHPFDPHIDHFEGLTEVFTGLSEESATDDLRRKHRIRAETYREVAAYLDDAKRGRADFGPGSQGGS